ncbi:MAG: hypothetical protein HFE33_00810 [Clostridia bacterium]|jgi:Na+/H+ antiporter NhaD/arsenite permease-like protein|nr:hypothetical protein [Clostridia bacterium]MCI9291382.1 hypothetical protein [Clostridia bacterium]MDE6884308.1 hypothetical protein [Clostridia bacterium]
MLLYQLLAFSFHWERFKQPSVIIGLVVMIVGLVFSFTSKSIANAIGQKRKAKGEDPNTDMLYTSLKFVSMGVVLIGMLVAIVTMQW